MDNRVHMTGDKQFCERVPIPYVTLHKFGVGVDRRAVSMIKVIQR